MDKGKGGCPIFKMSPPFGWYLLHLPTKGWPSWVDLGGWLHTEINDPHWELNPDTVTHPSTNRARCRWTLLIETNTLPLRQTTTVTYVLYLTHCSSIWPGVHCRVSAQLSSHFHLTPHPTSPYRDASTCDLRQQYNILYHHDDTCSTYVQAYQTTKTTGQWKIY